MDNNQYAGTEGIPENQETAPAETGNMPAEESKPRRRFKLPVITIPALIGLLVMAGIFVVALFISMLRYNAIDGLSSRYVGFENYGRVMNAGLAAALVNTLGIRLLTLLVCGGLAAAMCAAYRKMKSDGAVLAVACLWLIPVGIPAAVFGAPVMNTTYNPNLFTCALAYLAGNGLQTLGIFCFAAGLYAYLKNEPFRGLLIAVLAWLLGILAINAMDSGIQSWASVAILSDDRNFMKYQTGYAFASVYAVIKIVVQVAIGAIAAVQLRKRTRTASLKEKTTRAEMILIPAAVACAAAAQLLFNAAEDINNVVMNTLVRNLLVALGGGAVGGLIAWSFVRLLKGVSGRWFGIIAVILPAALSCVVVQFMMMSRLHLMDNYVLSQALLAAFDARVILLVVSLAFILRARSKGRPVSLYLSLALLAGACTWGKIMSGLLYYYGNSEPVGILFYQNVWTGHIREGKITLLDSRLILNLLMIVPPFLMGIGAASMMKRAFAEPKE